MYAAIPIPTMYGGVQFRSRLEARWAAYWDLCAVKWQYEPIDLAGYIPDFLLFDSLILMEIKPLTSRVLDEPTLSVMKKIDSSGWAGIVWIGGVDPSVMLGRCRRQWGMSPRGRADDPRWREAGNVVQWKSPRRA